MRRDVYNFNGFITKDLDSIRKINPTDYQYDSSINFNGMNNVRIDVQVLGFIQQFNYSKVRKNEKGEPNLDDLELIRLLFEDGYCYYFAHMLKTAFNRGEVCICAPFAHFVWVDENYIPYDISGMSDAEYEYLIPEKFLGEDVVSDFKHIPNVSYYTTKEEIEDIIRRYKESEDYKKYLDFIAEN